MDRFVVMIDAGYLLRQAIEIVSNKLSTKRSDLQISDPVGLVKLLVERSRSALELGDMRLLRVYWYDGVLPLGLTPQQKTLGALEDVNFRGGTVNSQGKQKGVDPLIVTDLIELAANHAICDAAVITGDGDLAVGIELAQKKGVRIALIGVEDLSVGVSHKQSYEVTSRADRVHRIGAADLAQVMRYVATPPASSVSSQAPATALPKLTRPTANVLQVVPELTAPQKEAISNAVSNFVKAQASLAGAVDKNTKRVDASIDRALIHFVFTELNHGALSQREKVYAREALRLMLGI